MEKKHDNKFGSGFFWGLIFGAALVILFGTKRGRELLREISEKGAEMLEDFLKKQGITGDDEEEAVDSIVQEEVQETNGEAKPKSSGKRLFKGLRKKA